MKKPFLYLLTSLFLIGQASFSQVTKSSNAILIIEIDGRQKIQQLDGIGVNANTRSWNGKELEPALRLLLDSMKATIWRVIVETVEKWEEANDNEDPFTFNWRYYDNIRIA